MEPKKYPMGIHCRITFCRYNENEKLILYQPSAKGDSSYGSVTQSICINSNLNIDKLGVKVSVSVVVPQVIHRSLA